MSNTFGNILRLTTFGESHGIAIGGVLDGMPAGVAIDMDEVQRVVDRRRPGQSAMTTSRSEDDRVEILSGVFDGVTLGTPIGFVIRNKDHHSADYSEIKECYRPSHADYTYDAKYGIRDYRGGGRSSARETAARVVGGAIAMQALKQLGITVTAYTSQIGTVLLGASKKVDLSNIDSNTVRCPDADTAALMEAEVMAARAAGDSLGGCVSCVVNGVPAGLGEPVFGKLHAQLGAAMLGINAAKGFEYGDGFAFAGARGSEVMDRFTSCDGTVTTLDNHSGGIQGGISNGAPITFRVAFKPVATLMRDIETIDRNGNPVTLHPHGRHDPCVVPRAVPIVEAMAALVMLDNVLMARTSRL
ncbi:chorismate synthase [Sodaliphilus sp.]|uniref:chorismate synthase n=1 Tax=Sodaliphilus sp. TaxID=2815818 RepID=UPI00388F1B16